MKNFIINFNIDSSTVVGCYWPINSELDTRPLICSLNEKNIGIALPIIRQNKMSFKSWKPQEKLYFSKYKFFSPSTQAKDLSPDIIITPALAVDNQGYRIGYGKGFYDKFFGENKSKVYVGYIYANKVLRLYLLTNMT